MIYRVTVTDSRTGATLWKREYATRPAAMRYAKAAVRTNTKATVSKVKGDTPSPGLMVLLTPDI